jgi:hypothetical protein
LHARSVEFIEAVIAKRLEKHAFSVLQQKSGLTGQTLALIASLTIENQISAELAIIIH